MYHLPPLYSLRAFEAAARLNSFSRASKELNITPAAIAHQVRKLEQDIGVSLFRRLARGVELNDAGAQYLDIVQSVLGELMRESTRFQAQFALRPIRIGALHVVTERLVRPLLHDFLQSFPEVRAELIDDREEPDFRSGDHDIVIWYGDAPPEGALSFELMSERLTPVCAPALLANYPQGMPLEALREIPALYDLHWESDWDLWLQHVGRPKLPLSLGFSLYSAMIQSVLEGAGIAIGHTGLLEKELRLGHLVRPFRAEITAPKSYFALTSQDNLKKHNVMVFWDWLRNRPR